MVLRIPLYLDIPEDGDLNAKTCSRCNLKYDLVSVMCVSLSKQRNVLTQRYTILQETKKTDRSVIDQRLKHVTFSFTKI